jgi:lysozyme family protein
MNRFEIALDFTLKNEGGYSNHPKDKGGRTIYGISVVFHPAAYYQIKRAKTKEEEFKFVKDFYYKEYWNPLYDELKDAVLAVRIFDLSVNIGRERTVYLLQTALNKINENLSGQVVTDGIFGKNTLDAINKQDEVFYDFFTQVIVKQFYESRKTFKVFGKGWLRRLNRKIECQES